VKDETKGARVSDAAQPVQRPAETSYPKPYLVYVLALLFVAAALNISDRSLFAVMIPQIKAEFGLSDSTMGALGGPYFAVAYVLFSLPLAVLADRWSRRKVLALSVAVFSAMTALGGLAANVLQLSIARIGVGIGEAGGFPPAQSIIASTFSAKQRTTALGVMAAGIYAGVLLGTTVAGHMTVALGWRQTFILLAIPGVVVALLAWTTLPRRPTGFSALGKAPVGETVLACLKSRTLILITLASGISNISGLAMQFWFPTFLVRSHGMPMQEAATWIGAMAVIGGIIGTVGGGILADRLRRIHESWQVWIGAVSLIVGAPILFAQFLLPAGVNLNLLGFKIPVIFLLSCTYSACYSATQAPAFGAAMSVVPARYRSMSGAVYTAGLTLIAAVIGPWLVGALSDGLTAQYGLESLRYALLLAPIPVVIGSALFWWAGAFYRREKAAADAGTPA